MTKLLLRATPAFLLSMATAQVEVVTTVFHRATATAIWVEREPRKTHGLAELEHGCPVWKDSYRLEDFHGKRLRFGAGAFASLRTSAALKIAGVDVSAGTYSLAFDCNAEGRWSIALLDPKELEQEAIPPYRSDRTAGLGVLAPLRLEASETPSERFSVSFEPADGDAAEVVLTIRWGPHRLTAPVRISTKSG